MNLTLLVSIAVAMPQQYPSATVHHWIIVYTADMMICHTNVQQLIINLVVLGRGGGDSRRCFAVVSCFRFRSKKHTHTHTYVRTKYLHIHFVVCTGTINSYSCNFREKNDDNDGDGGNNTRWYTNQIQFHFQKYHPARTLHVYVVHLLSSACIRTHTP